MTNSYTFRFSPLTAPEFAREQYAFLSSSRSAPYTLQGLPTTPLPEYAPFPLVALRNEDRTRFSPETMYGSIPRAARKETLSAAKLFYSNFAHLWITVLAFRVLEYILEKP